MARWLSARSGSVEEAGVAQVLKYLFLGFNPPTNMPKRESKEVYKPR